VPWQGGALETSGDAVKKRYGVGTGAACDALYRTPGSAAGCAGRCLAVGLRALTVSWPTQALPSGRPALHVEAYKAEPLTVRA